MADHHGTAGVVAELLEGVKATLPAGAEQLDLLAASQRPSGDRLSWDDAKVQAEAQRTKKAGRPVNAQNIATRELKEWIVHILGGTPQERMARWLMLEPEEMAKRLGCKVVEAFDRQQAILKELAPYFMARMQPVDDQGRPVPLFQMVFGGQVAGSDGRAPWERSFEPLEGSAVDVTPRGAEE